jgi:hypothetical protein
MFTKKTCITFMLLFFITILFHTGVLFAQVPGMVTCNTTSSPSASSVFNVGRWKPSKTPPTSNEDYFLRVLVVFVEFKNDNTDPGSTVWAPNTDPAYMDNLFAGNKELGLNAYSEADETVSDYFNWISNDQLDIIGDVYRIVLPKEYSQYSWFTDTHTDVFRMLDTNLDIDWSLYDNWKWNYTNEEFEKTPDDTLDMIIIQHRRQNIFSTNYGGFAGVSVDYNTLQGGKRIDGGFYSYRGSGVTQLNGATIPKEAFIGLFSHEYCHFMLGQHRPYSRIGGDDGTERIMGYELALSPQDMISVGYADLTTFTGSTESYALEDMITSGDVLKIQTTNSGESFLIGNRQRVRKYDCNMGGDTAMGYPFLQFHDYSKGLYIYHVTGGDDYDAWPDLECADGLWNWSLDGTSTPDWNDMQVLPVFYKSGVGTLDDNPQTAVNNSGRMLSRDGHSLTDYTNSTTTGYHHKWFTPGLRHTTTGGKGTDRVFTYKEENYCSRETMGDRWDAWTNNYNEVFSPYSSPNTKDRAGNQTGIFVYLDTILSGEATVKVYQVGEGGWDESEILEATPPSKPLLYRPITLHNCTSNWANPRITWDNNMEPDMLTGGGFFQFKRYKIYRSVSENDNTFPAYTYLDTYDDYTPTDTANYIDNHITNGVKVYCGSGLGSNTTHFRYKIVAVDNTGWESVMSDFVYRKGVQNEEDRPGRETENTAPTKYSLQQNYPNPFNPSTSVRFELPQNAYVTVKVYNALGEEVAILVNNEYKSVGRYSVTFDGTNLASGIYLYSIEAGVFRDTKKMVLIK